MQLLLRWIISAVALYITVLVGRALHLPFWIAPGLPGVQGLLLFALALGIANAVLRPIVQFFTVPLSCLTFGLFAFVINALMFWLAGQVANQTTGGIRVAGWEAPLFGSIVMAVISGALNFVLISSRERRR
jgi:putative membrane protein